MNPGMEKNAIAIRKAIQDFCASKNVRTIEHNIDPSLSSKGKLHFSVWGGAAPRVLSAPTMLPCATKKTRERGLKFNEQRGLGSEFAKLG